MNKPKTFRTQISEWFDRDKCLFSSLTIFTGLFFFYHQFTRDTLKSDKDLLQLKGIVKDYSFADKQGGRGMTHEYYIWLDGYKNAFQIPADYLGYFKKEEFETQVRKGDSLSLTIPRQKMIKLNDSNDDIYVMSLDKHNYNYLDKVKTMENENSGFDIYAGIFFLVIGIAFYFFKRW
ncbi:MAG: hypothetical protein Q8L81_08945 [Bacteroidota bacterium]|nr:hypothetical protein [Bacteroidota bacterium]